MNKICTDIEQSQKLIELGIDITTADMYWWYSGKRYYVESMDDDDFNKESDIPAWSLAALLSVLPYPHLEQNYKGKWCCRTEYADTTYLWEADNPVDACYEMIIKLHEQKLL